jgi:hypothetical protein
MMWDGSFEPDGANDRFVLDAILEFEEPQSPLINHTGHYDDDLIAWSRVLVSSRHDFIILKENDHLRALLKGFLELNIQVARCRHLIVRERQRGAIGRWLGRQRLNDLEVKIKDLEIVRDAAYKKYEMLRRLTCWDNKLLNRRPA